MCHEFSAMMYHEFSAEMRHPQVQYEVKPTAKNKKMKDVFKVHLATPEAR
jgi:hypothetical protein